MSTGAPPPGSPSTVTDADHGDDRPAPADTDDEAVNDTEARYGDDESPA